jgi:Spy/CpxP family protein refolding chaperone
MMRAAVSLIALLLGAAAALAQGPPPGGPGHPGRPLFLEQLFVPEQVMRYQQDIGLSDEQRAKITAAMGETQKQLIDLQWQFEGESKKLTDMLAAPTVDEAAVTAQADKVMNLELQMKRTHLGLLIRIKNVLTPEQQSKLKALRAKDPRPPGPPR